MAEGRQAVENALDFGQLFTGMSFFIVVSALLLTGLLAAFSLEQRLSESGLLNAMGFTPSAFFCRSAG